MATIARLRLLDRARDGHAVSVWRELAWFLLWRGVTVAIKTCGVVQPPVTWGPVLPARVFGVFPVAFMCCMTVVTANALVHGEGLELVLGLAVFPIMAVLAWKSSVGSWLRLTSTEVIVCNPLEVVRIPLQGVVDVSAGYGGVTITRADRTRVGAWAVQKTNLASWFHWRTRADDVVEAILAAAREAGAQIRVKPVAQQPIRKELRSELRRYPKDFHARHGGHSRAESVSGLPACTPASFRL